MKSTLAVITGVFTLIAPNLTVAGEYEKILRHQYALETPQKMVVEADVGDLILLKSPSGSILVDVLLSVKAKSQSHADSLFDNVTAEFLTPKEASARINVRSNGSGFYWFMFWKRVPDIVITLYIPDGIDLTIASGTGDIVGGDFSATSTIATGTGDLDLDRVSGSLSIATGTGDVDLKAFDGKLSAATGAGDFDGTGNFSEFSISTGKGDVRILVDNPVSENSQISTGMGDITVGLPVGSAFQLAADVGFGDISTDFDITDTDPDEKKFRGTYNEGSVKLNFNTGFGDVSVGRR